MAKHGENIYKRKDGMYEGRYVIGRKPDGKTKLGYIYGYHYIKVRDSLLLKKAALVALSRKGAVKHRTFAQWSETWRQNELIGSVKPSSYQTYLNILKYHLVPAFGQYLITSLTAEIIQNYIELLEERGFARSSIQGIIRLLSTIMRSAQQEGIIRRNPCQKIRLRGGGISNQRVLNRQEQKRLVNSLQNERSVPALLGLYTGMRLGEICALRWEDINWEQKVIYIRRTVQRLKSNDFNGNANRTKLFVGSPKSKSSERTVPVPQFILKILRNMEKDTDRLGYIFGIAEQPAEPRTIQRRFASQARRNGIQGVHFHTLRHSFATRMLELGIDVKTVSVLLGHSSVRMTMDFYMHSLNENQRQAVKRLEDAFA